MSESVHAAGFHLYLVRHGESANNALPDAQRVADPALTELGQNQVLQLGQHYRDHERIDLVLASPFRRTLQTTQPLLEARDMQATIWTELYEVGGCIHGHEPGNLRGAPGMTDAEIAAEFPRFAIPDDIDGNGWYKSQPFETREHAQERAATQAQRLRDEFEHTNQVVFCVIHADFKQLLLQQLLPDAPEYHAVSVPNSSVSHLHFANGATRVHKCCDIAHLDPYQISH